MGADDRRCNTGVNDGAAGARQAARDTCFVMFERVGPGCALHL